MVAIARIDHPHRGRLICRRPSRHRNDAGAELIEFAFVLPVLLMVIMAILDFGFLFQRYEVVTNAAREGARVGVLPDYGLADAEARAESYLAAAGLRGAHTAPHAEAATITWTNAGGTTVSAGGILVRVTYPHTFQFLGPIATLFGGSFGTVQLTAEATMRIEAD